MLHPKQSRPHSSRGHWYSEWRDPWMHTMSELCKTLHYMRWWWTAASKLNSIFIKGLDIYNDWLSLYISKDSPGAKMCVMEGNPSFRVMTQLDPSLSMWFSDHLKNLVRRWWWWWCTSWGKKTCMLICLHCTAFTYMACATEHAAHTSCMYMPVVPTCFLMAPTKNWGCWTRWRMKKMWCGNRPLDPTWSNLTLIFVNW